MGYQGKIGRNSRFVWKFKTMKIINDVCNFGFFYFPKQTICTQSTLRAEPPFVFFFTEEEKSRLCPNRVNSLKPPQPELLD